MISRIHSVALWGLDAFEICVETDSFSGLPGFSLVGLPDNAVREARERLLAALKNQGFKGIQRRTIINLSPAGRRKEGAALDLPMAIGLLVASEQFCSKIDLEEILIAGELSLDGSLLPIRGALNLLLFAKENGFKKLLIPAANAEEVRIDLGIEVMTANNLYESIQILEGELPQSALDLTSLPPPLPNFNQLDFSEVRGQYIVRRALEIAAAGAHNFLLIGSPGSGKSMCAKRITSILPPLDLEEALECTRIHSVAGLISKGKGLLQQRPFRSPHHTLSPISLTGGGSWPRPGECSLAHNGILFLDELPEFSRQALETLRQPLEDGIVTISRAAASTTFPSRFMLGAAMNPCPCGNYGDPKRQCHCKIWDIQRYRQRLSGPLLDRIDIQIEVPSLSAEEFLSNKPSECSESIRKRVYLARQIQNERLHGTHLRTNSELSSHLIQRYCALKTDASLLLMNAIDSMGISARGHDRILRVARTIADLEMSEQIEAHHLGEALQYRCTSQWQKESFNIQKNESERVLAIGGKSMLRWS